MIAESPWLWVGFIAFVLAMLALDLGVFQRKAHAVSMRSAAIWTAVWISLALVFNLVLYVWQGAEPALEFLTGYLIEKALSVDNLFVFALLFTMFGVPAAYQHRVLFWGVLGALVMRGAFIAGGAALLQQLPLDHLRLRRVPGVHRHQAGRSQGDGDPPRAQPGDPAVPAPHARSRRATRASASSSATPAS